MKIFLLSLLTLICITVDAQTDTIHYFNKLNHTCSQPEADYRIVVKKAGRDSYVQKTQKINRKLERDLDDEVRIIITSDSTYDIMRKNSYVKTCIFHRCDSGYIITEPDYKTISTGFSRSLFPIVKYGIWKVCSNPGKKKLSEETYKGNEMIGNLNWYEDGSPYISDVFTYVDTPPLFNNASSDFQMEVAQEIRYPEIAVENGIMGKVFVQFVVLKDGSIDGARVLRGVHPELDSEALRAVRSVKGKWTPATIRSNEVNAFVVMPVIFRLQE